MSVPTIELRAHGISNMETFHCVCGGRLFFNNSVCVGCGREVGWCEACCTVAPLEAREEGYRCANPACQSPVVKCHNYAVEAVCNRVYVADDSSAAGLCQACRLNEVIPDLSVEVNRERWAKLETAKRRLLYQLDELGLRYAAGDVPEGTPPLRFAFQASTPEAPVMTGHADGLVTINISEADSVERERVRKEMHEPHRTLVGHMRHEIGHYYWMALVAGKCEQEFIALFGDHRDPPYAEALEQYHASGPAADWQARCVSAYAAAHPWEDFAETWGFYLDMWAVLTTTHHHLPAVAIEPQTLPIDALIKMYQQLGMFFNEVNRTMGLTDLVPEVISPEVVKKLVFIDRLVRPEGGD